MAYFIRFLPSGAGIYLVEHIVSGQSMHVVLFVSGIPSHCWNKGR